jgi:hypothetical protein
VTRLFSHLEIQGQTGHNSNATLIAGAFKISHTKCQKGAFWRNFGGFLYFFVCMVAEAFHLSLSLPGNVGKLMIIGFEGHDEIFKEALSIEVQRYGGYNVDTFHTKHSLSIFVYQNNNLFFIKFLACSQFYQF